MGSRLKYKFLKILGAGGFIFFFLKGILWIVIFFTGAYGIGIF
tara:strand:+ start:22811 stop:22939 length:129 start_codon:yes stop_codon:yes gene_type:complete